MTDKEKLEAFLRELEALCAKYDARMGGCGCCNSPWVRIGNEWAEDVNLPPKQE